MTTRKIISLILCLAICMSICSNFSLVKAADATLDLLTFTLSDDGEYYKAGAKDTSVSGEIVIPAYYDGLPVTQVAADGFCNCSEITKVTLPDTIVRIGSTSFYYATSLEEINIPDSVKYIGQSAFTKCEKLRTVTIPDSVTHIGKSVFNQSGLESVIIPDSVIYEDVKNVGTSTPFTAKGLFQACASLKSVKLPANIEKIGESAFSWCENLEEIVIPESVTTIGEKAFSWCAQLKSIMLPEGITTIEASAFAGCSGLSDIYIPDSVENMSKSAFSLYNEKLRLAFISLPGGISLADKSASDWGIKAHHIFYRGTEEQFNETLATLDEGNNSSVSQVKNFDYDTVHFNCTGKETYTLTENLAVHCLRSGGRIYNCSVCGSVHDTKIGGYGDHIRAEDGTCTMCGEGIEDSSEYLDFTRPSGADHYSVSGCDTNATGAIVIPEEHAGLPVKSIGVNAFKDCRNITSVYIPDSVEYIRNYAFYNCTSLKAIILPSSIKQMGGTRSSFSNCNSLEGIYIYDLTAWCNIDFPSYTCNPLYTGANLYLWGELVEDLVIPEYVDTVKTHAFTHYNALKSVTFNEGIKEIGEKAFAGCSNLSEINIPDSTLKIRNEAFKNTAYYKDTSNWEDNILYIDNHLIKSNNDSQTITVKDNTVTIADCAFEAVSTLKEVYLPDSLVRIGDYAFFANTALNEVFWGRGVQYIGAHAFEATPEMDVLNLSGSLKGISIGDYAFASSGFYEVFFPVSVTEFNPTAFYDTENLTVIKCSYNNPAFVAENNVLYTKDKSKLLLASKNPTEDYVIPEETKVIEDYAFMLLDESISVTLHDNLERIGKDAFEYTKYTAGTPSTCYVGNYLVASYVNDLVVKEGTLGIADDSLHEVTGLVIPESLRFIGDSLEYIGRIDIPSVENWCKMDLQHPESGEVYLQNCIHIYMNNERLSEIEIPYSVTTLKAYRFGDCSTLKKVIIPPTVTTIEDNAFFNFSEDLVIHCLEGSAACSYAHANNITCCDLSIASKSGTNIDYGNKIIYTSTYSAKDISSLVYIAESKTTVALGSDYVNGKHIFGTGSTVTVYGDNEREDFTLIVTGDVNGDSVCDVLDIAQTGLAANEHKQLTDAYLLAGDTNMDEEITVEDYARVVNLALAG